jgi:hypothetical protein
MGRVATNLRRETRRRASLRVVALAAVGFLAILVVAAGPAYAVLCPTCGRDAEDTHRFCPHDGTKLPEPGCPECKRPVDPSWSYCPFDGRPLQARTPSAPASPAPATPPAAAAPAPGGSGEAAAGATGSTVPAGAPKLPPGSPLAVVDTLFEAIEAGSVETIRPLYLWPAFFPDVPLEELDAKVTAYITRLIDGVRPTIAGSTRGTPKLFLGSNEATVRVAVRSADTRQATEYIFTLVADSDGWKITSIRP